MNLLNLSVKGSEIQLDYPNSAVMEALEVILVHEKIPYTIGLGSATRVFFVPLAKLDSLTRAILQWKDATRVIFDGFANNYQNVVG